MDVLDLDFSRANAVPQDYDTDLESEWSNLSIISFSLIIKAILFLDLFANGNDFSSETIEENRNLDYQKQLANQIATEVTQTISLLTSALNIHLNIGQNMTINSSSVFMSLETISFESLSDKLIEQTENGHILISSNYNTNRIVSLRVCFLFLFQGIIFLFSR
jgi:hypothetical protein